MNRALVPVSALAALTCVGCLDWQTLRDKSRLPTAPDAATFDARAPDTDLRILAQWTFAGSGRVRTVPDTVGRISGADLDLDPPNSAEVLPLENGVATISESTRLGLSRPTAEMIGALAAAGDGASIEFWVQTTDTFPRVEMMSVSCLGTIFTQVNEGTEIAITTTGSGLKLVTPRSTAWQDLTVVLDYKMGTASVYLDGSVVQLRGVATDAVAHPVPALPAGYEPQLHIGGTELGWRGRIAAITLFESALPASLIRSRYEAGPP